LYELVLAGVQQRVIAPVVAHILAQALEEGGAVPAARATFREVLRWMLVNLSGLAVIRRQAHPHVRRIAVPLVLIEERMGAVIQALRLSVRAPTEAVVTLAEDLDLLEASFFTWRRLPGERPKP
jgi:hypothetical protein